MISNDAQDILVRAAEYLKDPKHWMQGNITDDKERVCAIGALRKAAREQGLSNVGMWDTHGWIHCSPYIEAGKALLRAVNTHTAYVYRGIPTWNDEPHTTHAGVHEAFCTAIQETIHDTTSTD